MSSLSIFNEISNEFLGEFYKTKPLSVVPNRIQSLKTVAAAIYTNFVNFSYWEFECQKGSLTLRQHFHDNCNMCKKTQHKVIKVFIDFGNELARLESVDHLVGENPIAVGIELGYEDPVIRKNIRDYFRRTFKKLYLDPVNGHSKYYLDPSKHYYDIVFIPKGPCEFPIDEELYKKISDEIDKKIGLYPEEYAVNPEIPKNYSKGSVVTVNSSDIEILNNDEGYLYRLTIERHLWDSFKIPHSIVLKAIAAINNYSVSLTQEQIDDMHGKKRESFNLSVSEANKIQDIINYILSDTKKTQTELEKSNYSMHVGHKNPILITLEKLVNTKKYKRNVIFSFQCDAIHVESGLLFDILKIMKIN